MAKRGRKPGKPQAPTPEQAKARSLVVRLAAQGLPVSGIVEEAGRRGVRVSRASVYRWTSAPAAPASPPRRAARSSASASSRERAAPEVEALAAAAAELADEAAVADLQRRVDAKLDEVEREGDAIDFVRLVRLRAELAVARAKTRPPVPPDPATDPANTEAQRLVRSMLFGVVEPLPLATTTPTPRSPRR